MRRVPRLLSWLAGAFVLTIAVAAGVDADSAQDGCRCATTFQGAGSTRVVVCEGFNPQSHQRCECEQIQVNQQTGCRPQTSDGSNSRAGRNPTPRPGRNG